MNKFWLDIGSINVHGSIFVQTTGVGNNSWMQVPGTTITYTTYYLSYQNINITITLLRLCLK